MCYVPPSVELLGPASPQFPNPDPRQPQISKQIDTPAISTSSLMIDKEGLSDSDIGAMPKQPLNAV